MTPFYANLCALCAIAHVIAKRIFLCNTLVCFHNQMCNECSDQDNHNQAGDEAIAQRAGCDQCTNLVYEECDCEACCKLQTNAAEQPFFALDFRVHRTHCREARRCIQVEHQVCQSSYLCQTHNGCNLIAAAYHSKLPAYQLRFPLR